MAYIPNMTFSYTRSAGVPASVNSNTTGGVGSPGYVPLARRAESRGNVFNPSNANAMDYSLYTNYYSPSPAMSLGEMVGQMQGQKPQPSGYTGQQWGAPSSSGVQYGNAFGRGKSLSVGGSAANPGQLAPGEQYAQTPEQARQQRLDEIANTAQWWGDSGGQAHYEGAPSQETVRGWVSSLSGQQQAVEQARANAQSLLQLSNQAGSPEVSKYYLQKYYEALQNLTNAQNEYSQLQGDINNWTSWYKSRGINI